MPQVAGALVKLSRSSPTPEAWTVTTEPAADWTAVLPLVQPEHTVLASSRPANAVVIVSPAPSLPAAPVVVTDEIEMLGTFVSVKVAWPAPVALAEIVAVPAFGPAVSADEVAWPLLPVVATQLDPLGLDLHPVVLKDAD